MSAARRFFTRLTNFGRGGRYAERLREELEQHIAFETERNQQAGMSGGEARRQAILKLGPVEAVKESYQAERSFPLLETLVQDARYTLRGLYRNPGFAIVSILTLALGIGAFTAIFSIVDGVLLRSLPYPHPEQLVRVWEQAPDGHRMSFAQPNFDDLLARNHAFTALASYSCGDTSVTGANEPQHLQVAAVSKNFFPAFGVQPLLGRTFTTGEVQAGGVPAALVSYRFWRQSLGMSADLKGRQLKIDGRLYTVIGVMPSSFDYPLGMSAWTSSEIDPPALSRTAHNLRVVARMRNGLGPQQAGADANAVAGQIRHEYGTEVDLSGATIQLLSDTIVGDVRSAILVLFGAVAVLLLVACSNVAGLLVARASARRREFAIRTALGAGRARLLQQLFTESLILALAAGSLGILLAVLAVRLLPHVVPSTLPHQQGIRVDLHVLCFALLSTVAITLVLAAVAAWHTVRMQRAAGPSQGLHNVGSLGHTQRLRSALVMAEVAITLVLLVGGGLLARSFIRLTLTDPGFSAANLLTISMFPEQPQGDDQARQAALTRQTQQFEAILETLRALPGVQSAAVSSAMPVAAGDDLADGTFILLHGQPAPGDLKAFARMSQNKFDTGSAGFDVVSDDYFRTLGVPLLRGRMFYASDTPEGENVAVISQTLARQRWPNQDPIGQSIEFGNMDGNLKPLTIVGIVGDVRSGGVNQAPGDIVYVDHRQRGVSSFASSPTILVRTGLPLAGLIHPFAGIFKSLAPGMPVRFSTFQAEIGEWLADRRFLLAMVGTFALAALGLAAMGIYGVVSFTVAQRTQEIGIRLALGAQRAQVLRMIVGEGVRRTSAGVAIGVAVALGLTRLVASLLFGVQPDDPVTFLGVAVLLEAVALGASVIPASRAMAINPVDALRSE